MKYLKKSILLLLGFSILIHAQNSKLDSIYNDSIKIYYKEQISEKLIKKWVYALSSNSLEGRATSSQGQLKAAHYIVNEFQGENFDIHLQEYEFYQNYYVDNKPTQNIMVKIPGSTYTNEFVVISAHYDHLGKEKDNIYPGADDNASGTAAVMEIVRLFHSAFKNGRLPKRNIIFILFSGEELGLLGSQAFMQEFKLPKSYIYANINIDMIGRVDNKHKKKPNYLYIVGSDYFTDDIDKILDEVNQEDGHMELNKRYNSLYDSSKLHLRSDSYHFARYGIPFVFFHSGDHIDYHRTSDTADKIDYDVLTKRTQFIFSFAWELANRDTPINIMKSKVDDYRKYFSNYY